MPTPVAKFAHMYLYVNNIVMFDSTVWVALLTSMLSLAMGNARPLHGCFQWQRNAAWNVLYSSTYQQSTVLFFSLSWHTPHRLDLEKPVFKVTTGNMILFFYTGFIPPIFNIKITGCTTGQGSMGDGLRDIPNLQKRPGQWNHGIEACHQFL